MVFEYNFPFECYFIWRGAFSAVGTSLLAETVMCLSTMQETRVQSLVWEDPLEKEMAIHSSTSLIAQLEKNMPAMQETQVQFLGQEDHLEKEMAIHSSFLAWKIPWTEELGRLQSMGFQRVRHN